MLARFAIAGFTVFTSVAAAAEVSGPAQVIDAGALDVGGRTVALAGVSAPAFDAQCGARRCGQDAAWALAARIERHWTVCDDQAGGAVCYIGGRNGLNLNAWVVQEGWARACGPDYAAQENEARAGRRGLWADAGLATRTC